MHGRGGMCGEGVACMAGGMHGTEGGHVCVGGMHCYKFLCVIEFCSHLVVGSISSHVDYIQK